MMKRSKVYAVDFVTSYAEVWIEICAAIYNIKHEFVTSYAEVWIEIDIVREAIRLLMSPPTRRCGLK